MRRVGIFSIFAFVCLTLIGTSVAQEKPVTLGALYGLTGDWSPYGIPSSRGAMLYAEQANEAGGVLGRPLKLIIKDTTGSVEGAAGLASEILTEDPHVSALFGLSESDPVRAAAEVAAKAERLFVTSGATSPVLPYEVPTYLFLACFGDNVQAAAAAEFAYGTLKARSVAILYDAKHTYTRLLQDYFAKSFEARGGKVVSSIKFQGSEKFAAAAIRTADADIIFVAAEIPPEAAEYAKTLRDNGFDQPIVGGDGFDGDTAWKADQSLKDIYFTTHAFFGGDNLSAGLQEFRDAYAAAYDAAIPGAFAGLGYDTAGLLIAAIEKAGSADPDKLLQALSTLEGYEGVTGTISFVDDNRVPRKSVTILQIADGKRNFVDEIIPTQIPKP